MAIREGKITNCAALSTFLLTMSRLSQKQWAYNFTISMLVNGASSDAVPQYLVFTVSRLQTRVRHSGTLYDSQRSGQLRAVTPALDRYTSAGDGYNDLAQGMDITI